MHRTSMHFRYLGWTYLFGFHLSLWSVKFLCFGCWLVCSAAWTFPFSKTEREVCWARARAQLLSQSRLVYFDEASRQPPNYPAFLVTNEYEFPFIQPRVTPGDLHVGFATTINFVLLGAQKNKAFLVIDQSEEAVVAMMSLFRPLFLASPTPQYWIATIAGLKTHPEETVDSVFQRIGTYETKDLDVLEDLAKKLKPLMRSGAISQFDYWFTLAVIRDQIDPRRPYMGVSPYFGLRLQKHTSQKPCIATSLPRED